MNYRAAQTFRLVDIPYAVVSNAWSGDEVLRQLKDCRVGDPRSASCDRAMWGLVSDWKAQEAFLSIVPAIVCLALALTVAVGSSVIHAAAIARKAAW